MSTVLEPVAYHSDKKLKKSIVAQVLGHQKADEIIKGTYWEDGKGCAVGCIAHAHNEEQSPHKILSAKIGVPVWIAHVIDGIFEGLPNAEAKLFPLAFVKAVPVGFDKWEDLRHDFLAWLLIDPVHGAIKYGAGFPAVEQAIKDVAKLHQERCKDQQKWDAAARSAYAAARSAQADKLLSLLIEAARTTEACDTMKSES